MIWSLPETKKCPRLKAAGGKDFEHSIVELSYQLNVNRVQGSIKLLEFDDPDERDLSVQGARACYKMAAQGAEHLGTDWRPNPQQQGKLCLRLATLLRLVDRITKML